MNLLIELRLACSTIQILTSGTLAVPWAARMLSNQGNIVLRLVTYMAALLRYLISAQNTYLYCLLGKYLNLCNRNYMIVQISKF